MKITWAAGAKPTGSPSGSVADRGTLTTSWLAGTVRSAGADSTGGRFVTVSVNVLLSASDRSRAVTVTTRLPAKPFSRSMVSVLPETLREACGRLTWALYSRAGSAW